MGGLAAAACSKFLGAPLFVELHGNHYFAPVRSGIIGKIEYYAYRLFSKVSFAAATQIRTLSDEMSASLRAHYGEKVSRKIVMIPTRVDLEIFSNIKKDYRIGSKLKLITVGSLSPRKNHINLMRDLAAGNLPFELTIVGDGLLRNQYLQVIDELNISSQVILTGNMAHSDLADLLITQDIYIHYSLSEGLPRAILEAMAVALPVITSPVGFTKNIFLNGENSVILENPLAASLRRELGEISLSIEMRCKLGISARKLIEDKFNANDIFRLYRAAVLQMTSMSN
ncbi:MAG: glycosyltransferase [Proteobacteria bacterium]|nr:MAG: glycosyltransferase [Pseudomonadota bacterium]